MTDMTALRAGLILAIIVHGSDAGAYGGGGSSGSCSEPHFYDESPSPNSTVAALKAIELKASDDTDIASLELEVDGKRLKPEIFLLRSGEWQIRADLPGPITEAGRVRITVTAKSKDGCPAFHPYYLAITPG